MICRHRGYCFSFVQAPGPTTPSATCRRNSRTTSRSTTTLPSQQLWQNSRNPAPSPLQPWPEHTCHSLTVAWACFQPPASPRGILGLLGRHLANPPHTSSPSHSRTSTPLPRIHARATFVPSNPSSGRTPHPSWLGTSALRTTSPWSRAPAPAKHRRPRSAHIPQRLAATRCGSTTQSNERRAAHHAGPRQPSHARVPIRALCQQSLRHHSLLRRPVISVPLVSNLAPQVPPPPASPH